MSESKTSDLVWVSKTENLLRLMDDLMQHPIVAVDTESNSLFAYRERVCLIQFSTPQVDYLLDPFSFNDLSALAPFFLAPEIEKVFHAAEYDLICLKRDYGFVFNNLFDTMLAARILGHPGLGLGTMLEEKYGVVADKRFQRANWARRPLTQEMLDYARMDTHYLIPLRDSLRQQLIDATRLSLAEEDFRRLTQVPAGSHENGAGCWKIAGVQDLSPRQAAVLVQVWNFRDDQARLMNQPAFRVLPNQILMDLAQIMPRKRADLSRVPNLSPKLIQRYGTDLLEAVQRGIVGPPAYRPYSARPDDSLLWRLDALRTWRKNTGRNLGVESDIILPREVMEKIAVRDPRTLEDLAEVMTDVPWRLERFGQQILRTIHP